MNMKFVLIFILGTITLTGMQAQTNNKLWGGIEVGYGLGLSDRGDSYKISRGDGYKMAYSSLRAIVGYYVLPNFSVGGGIGLGSYTNPSLNTIPVFLDLRFHPLENNKKFILNGNLGYSIATSETDLNSKFQGEFSVGYKIFELGKISLIPSLGYNYCNYSIESLNKGSQSKHSLFLRVGFFY